MSIVSVVSVHCKCLLQESIVSVYCVFSSRGGVYILIGIHICRDFLNGFRKSRQHRCASQNISSRSGFLKINRENNFSRSGFLKINRRNIFLAEQPATIGKRPKSGKVLCFSREKNSV